MAKLELVNALPRMKPETGSAPSIYDETLEVVASGAGAGEINEADVQAGDAIALPAAQSYTGDELEVYYNGSRLTLAFDYLHTSSTAIELLFNGSAGDKIRFRIDRSA